MAKDKRSIILYTDLIHTLRMLTDVQRGQLMLTIFEYVNDLNPDVNDPILKVVFEPIKQQLKRDLKKYESKKKQWSDAGKASAEARKIKNKQTSTDVNGREQTPTDSTVNVNDSVNVSVNEIYNKYPSKCIVSNRSTGKSRKKNCEKIKALLKDNTKEELNFVIDKYVLDCKSTKTYMKNFSTFLNNLPDYDESHEIGKQKQLSSKKKFELRHHFSGTVKHIEADTEEEALQIFHKLTGAFIEDVKVCN